MENELVAWSVKKEGNSFISYCAWFDIYSQGNTEKEAIDNLIEACTMFLTSCLERDVVSETIASLNKRVMPDGISHAYCVNRGLKDTGEHYCVLTNNSS